MNINIEKILPDPFIELYKKWKDRKLTPEFDIEICELSVNTPVCIEDFKFKQLPTPTQDYKKWRFMSDKEKDEFRLNNPLFYQQNILEFGEEVQKIKNFNDRNRNQLKLWLTLNISEKARKTIEQILDTHSGENQ